MPTQEIFSVEPMYTPETKSTDKEVMLSVKDIVMILPNEYIFDLNTKYSLQLTMNVSVPENCFEFINAYWRSAAKDLNIYLSLSHDGKCIILSDTTIEDYIKSQGVLFKMALGNGTQDYNEALKTNERNRNEMNENFIKLKNDALKV